MPSIPDSDDLAGRDIAGYRILRRLGAGGMAEVYLADQQSLDRQVAFKILQPALARDATYVARFQHEARAAARLVHANIVQIYEVGQAEGVHFIAQEYVRGRNLAELLRRQASLPPALVLDVLRQVTAALSRAAEAGIVHRDIKPENILIAHSGEMKVADFGLARIASSEAQALTQAGITMGTPLYMSPEQIEGRPVDTRSDIYSLGVTAYHLLAGKPPHAGDTALAIAVQHLNAEPQPLGVVCRGVPTGLARVVHRMMAKKPDQRYATPAELLADLRKLAGEATAEAWGPGFSPEALADWQGPGVAGVQTPTAELSRLMASTVEPIKPQSSRRRAATIVAVVIALGGLIGFVTRPRPLLEGSSQTIDVPHRETEQQQLAHAALAPSVESWEAVEKYFPNGDPEVKDAARRGLVGYHLLISQDFRAAQRALDGWPEPDDRRLAAFRRAAQAIVSQRLGEPERARQTAAQLGSEARADLRRFDPQIDELLNQSLKQP